MIRITFTLLILGLFGWLTACTDIRSQPNQKESKSPDLSEWVIDDSLASYLQNFEQNFENGLNDKQIPGAAVAIVKDGRVIYQKGFGVQKRGETGEVNENTVFRLGSVSKGFASILTGLYVEEGSLDWNDPVSRHLAEFKLNDPEQTDRVQIRHLLSHTSGLPRHAYTNLVEDGLSLDRIIPRLERVPLISKEGVQIAYQNAAYSTIEKVLEAKADKEFNMLLKQRLFDPLNMKHASVSFSGIRDSENKAIPHIYYSKSRGRVPVSISKKYYNAVSSGGVNASASDMGKWLLLMTGNHPEIISNETLEQVFQPMATINNRRFSRHWEGVSYSQYGLGWRIMDNNGQRIVYHGGYVNGYRSEIAFSPDDNLGICILINSNSSYPLEVIPGFFNHFKADVSTILTD